MCSQCMRGRTVCSLLECRFNLSNMHAEPAPIGITSQSDNNASARSLHERRAEQMAARPGQPMHSIRLSMQMCELFYRRCALLALHLGEPQNVHELICMKGVELVDTILGHGALCNLGGNDRCV